MTTTPTMHDLGWRPFFQQQLSLDELTDFNIGRVIEQHKSGAVVMNDAGQKSLFQTPNDDKVCVGDWVLFDDSLKLYRCLERQSLFRRKAPGSKVDVQLISANIDTVMIVSSLNNDFNLGRIERYLALANEAQVEAVIVLTKADLCNDVDDKVQQVQKLDPLLLVYAINALAKDEVAKLMTYCQTGKTLAFLGSSGVGKSTLLNSFLGNEVQDTGSIREDDSKGRHTTTYRALRWFEQGGLLLDTPGMRELQLSFCEQGVSDTFAEITELITQCKFSNCSHNNEPGCVILAALDDGTLDPRRFKSYQKLMREQEFNSSTLAQKRAKDKALGKMINTVQAESRHFKKGR